MGRFTENIIFLEDGMFTEKHQKRSRTKIFGIVWKSIELKRELIIITFSACLNKFPIFYFLQRNY